MLPSDFVTVALIPTLIHLNSSEVGATNIQPNENRRVNSRQLPIPQSSEEDFFGKDAFFSNNGPSFNSPNQNQAQRINQQQPMTRDPILRAIFEEEKRLDLAGGDYDMRSEEARELISFQRRKLSMMRNFARQATAVIGIPPQTEPQGRSLSFEPRINRFPQEGQITHTTTQYPILMPTSSSSREERIPDTETTTTAKPATTGRLGIGGVFGKVKSGVGSAFNKIFGGGSSAATSTTVSPPSNNNNVYFPDDDEKPSPSRSPPPPPQYPSGGSNNIIFAEDLNCTGFKTEYNGACYNVLQQLPCPTGQWLVEDDNTGKGKCVENKCANVPNHAFFGGKCVMVRTEGTHCHKGMVTYIFKNGEVECDCKDLHLFSQRDGNCYPAYRRGPCNNGEIFATKTTQGGALPASCVRSKCSKDGFFCNAPSCPNDRNCVEFRSKCPTGVWGIHPERLAPACIDLNIHRPDKIIGNVPTLACAPGSRRDILGTCRKASKITFS